jgi:hypothetical protein
MRSYGITFRWQDRRIGPKSIMVRKQGTAPHVAVYKALREFWKAQDRKDRNDIRRAGLDIRVIDVGEVSKEEPRSAENI